MMPGNGEETEDWRERERESERERERKRKREDNVTIQRGTDIHWNKP